jgi:hypothetical protein
VLRDRDPFYDSLETESRGDADGHKTDVTVTGVGRVHEPAFGKAALGPVRFLVGRLESTSDRSRWTLDPIHRERLDRAAAHLGRPWQRRAETLTVHGHARGRVGWVDHLGRPIAGPTMRHRPASPILRIH